MLFGDLCINSGTTITIPAGVVFKSCTEWWSWGFWKIYVNGALVVNGTPTEKVVFTDYRDDTFGNPGDTNGDGSATQPTVTSGSRISFSDVSDDSVSSLRYTLLRYRDAGVDLSQSSPRISNCLFENGWVGVRLSGVSNPAIDSCTFNNLTYAPMLISLVSYPRSTVDNIISGTTYRSIGIVEETLAQDLTLTKRSFAGINNIPYTLGNYTIGTGATLTIEPGVILKFFDYYKYSSWSQLTVNKGLIAEGGSHPDSTIVFTDCRDDFYGGDTNADSTATVPGDWTGWLGIKFVDEALDSLCRLKNCVIRYTGSPCGGVVATSASPTITHSVISKNYYGIVVNAASNPIINYCDIFQNSNMGILNNNKSFNIDARWNWWGNNSGPTHSGNPGGTGDVVSDSVKYIPFQTYGAQQPLMGDVSLNGLVSAYDALFILRYVVDPIGNPLSSTQQYVADVSGTMGITAYDASLILQYVVGLIPNFPADTNSRTVPLYFPRQVVISSIEIGNLQCKNGATITVPIRFSNVQNLASTDIVLKYDGHILIPKDVKLGSGMSDMSIESKYSDGQLKIAIAGPKYIDISGEVVYITFDVAKEIKGDVKSEIGFVKVLLNEQNYTTMATSGELSINGKPKEFSLHQNYPNPFNPSTKIRYQIPEDGFMLRYQFIIWLES